MSIAREHTGPGWGDPLDPAQAEVWLCAGYVCVYDPQHPDRIEPWTESGPADGRYAYTNAGDAIVKRVQHWARPPMHIYRQILEANNGPDWETHSRFD